ncbi:hypothetical protein TIFTF001_023075 [Ficus carica]|uniref:Uncharacterized protein n=1 Tax=Ficus carica TaxID=3494 RepID=A0AA88AK99_FICCA|nr:hypothetical protein TIFTF001_023075 [Ficus carica]
MDSPNSLETLINEYIARNDARVQSHDATLRTLENQIGQIANALNVRPQGSLPSNTEDPRREGKEYCKAILLRNGREIERREKPKAVQNEPTSIQQQDELHQQEEILINEDDLAVSDEDKEASDNQVSWMESRHTAVRGGKHFGSLELSERAFQSHKPSVDEPPVLELKPLPTHLRDSGSKKKKRKKNWIHKISAALWSLPTHRSQRLSPKTPRCQLPSRRTLAPNHCFAPQRRHTDSPRCQLPTLNQRHAPTQQNTKQPSSDFTAHFHCGRSFDVKFPANHGIPKGLGALCQSP